MPRFVKPCVAREIFIFSKQRYILPDVRKTHSISQKSLKVFK